MVSHELYLDIAHICQYYQALLKMHFKWNKDSCTEPEVVRLFRHSSSCVSIKEGT